MKKLILTIAIITAGVIVYRKVRKDVTELFRDIDFDMSEMPCCDKFDVFVN